MISSLYKYICVLLLLAIWPACSYSQTELNVKLKANKPGQIQALYAAAQSGDLTDIHRIAAFRTIESVKPLLATYNEDNKLSLWFTLTLTDTISAAFITQLMQTGVIDRAEPNYRRKLDDVQSTNDPLVIEQYFHDLIHTYEAWETSSGQPGITIGFIDTGVDYFHPDLLGQFRVNSAEDINGNRRFDKGDLNNIDEDGNGYTDDVIGYDFTDQPKLLGGGDYLNPDADPMDINGHGTLVAGIMGARANNGYGITGIAPACKLLAIKAFSASGLGEDDDIARAIVYAAITGVDVLNFSFGDIYASTMMHEAIQYAQATGVVMVASAGNGSGDNLHYPSSFDEVISVAATAYDEASKTEYLWPLSSYGTSVSLSAPGSGILSLVPSDTLGEGHFALFSGTSTSAPMVSAGAALLKSVNPSLTTQQIRGILVTTADDVGNKGWDHFTGAGRLNLQKALKFKFGSNVQILSPANDQGSAKGIFHIVASILHPNFKSYRLQYEAGTEGSGLWIDLLVDAKKQVFADTIYHWDISVLADGEYTLRLLAELSNGRTVEDRIRFLINRTPPNTSITLATPVWDDDERKMLITYHSDQTCRTCLYIRKASDSSYKTVVNDKLSKTGEFLLYDALSGNGNYSYYIESTNAAGLKDTTAIDSLYYQGRRIANRGVVQLPYKIPSGYFVEKSYDIDGDARPEVIMSRFDSKLGYGRLEIHEFNAGKFDMVHSIAQPGILIPKAIADVDGNGLLELLCNYADEIYIFEQETPDSFPAILKSYSPTQRRYPASYADADGDGKTEILAKDEKDYYVLEYNGSTFNEVAQLYDVSGNFLASTSPRVVVADFDSDGKTELVYGDYDGDLIIYENTTDNTYRLEDTITSALFHSSDLLQKGDFDGDGKPEIFVATHSNTLQNAEHEYDPLYWHVQILKSTSANQYTTVWEDYIYNVNSQSYNAATVANLDGSVDLADEIVINTYPRTYMVDFDTTSQQYHMRWFLFGSLCRSGVTGDFNSNGILDFSVGVGDTTLFFEIDPTVSLAEAAFTLRGKLLTKSSIQLDWDYLSAADTFIIFRIHGDTLPDNISTTVPPVADTFFVDSFLISGDNYFYIVQAYRADTLVATSNVLSLRPHAPIALLAGNAQSNNRLKIDFSGAGIDRPSDIYKFKINGQAIAYALISAGNNSLLLSANQPFTPGVNTLTVDSSYLDAYGQTLAAPYSINFVYTPDSSRYIYLSAWQKTSDKSALLEFNTIPTASVLDISHYEVFPFGQVVSVSPVSDQANAVEVTIDEVVIGALGYSVAIRVSGITGAQGEVMRTNEGDVAMFAEHKNSLEDVYVYPNPVKINKVSQHCRFANLTSQANISILNVNGRVVRFLQETDGDGGLEWDLRDEAGHRVPAGIYLYYIVAEDGSSIKGKMAIVE